MNIQEIKQILDSNQSALNQIEIKTKNIGLTTCPCRIRIEGINLIVDLARPYKIEVNEIISFTEIAQKPAEFEEKPTIRIEFAGRRIYLTNEEMNAITYVVEGEFNYHEDCEPDENDHPADAEAKIECKARLDLLESVMEKFDNLKE